MCATGAGGWSAATDWDDAAASVARVDCSSLVVDGGGWPAVPQQWGAATAADYAAYHKNKKEGVQGVDSRV